MTNSVPRAEPLYMEQVGEQATPLFGWLHRAASPAKNLGLVICNPFGHEAQNTHRSLRHWAEGAAEEGISTLRFDFDGTGDSSGCEEDEARLTSWIGNIHRAIETLRETTGVSQIALLGVRWSALMATLAAVESPELYGLALIAPVISGKAWLREARALHNALGLEEPPADASPLPEGAREATGFLLTAPTIGELSNIDLLKLEKPPAQRVLILDRDDLPGGDKLAKHFASLGAMVDYQSPSGYSDMMRDPHQSQVPSAMINATLRWLDSSCADTKQASFVVSKRLADCAQISDAVQEQAVFLDEKRHLFGIVSLPRQKQPQKAILLINSGANHRTGPNRLYVKMARHWAEQGFMVVRLDIGGLGDSLPPEGAEEHIVYPSHALDDVQAALDYLRNRGMETCHAIGLCSGGYHAFKAAVKGVALDGVLLINPLTFFWKPGTALDAPASQTIAEAARYKQSVMQADKWKNLLTGQTDARVVAQMVRRRAVDVAGIRVRNMARRAGYQLQEDLGSELQDLAQRGVALHFIFSEGDPGLALLHEQGGAVVPRLIRAGKLSIQCIAGADHTFTPLWSQTRLIATLDETLGLTDLNDSGLTH